MSIDEYELKSDYFNILTKVEIVHKSCGHTFEMLPHNFLRGQRCPNCKKTSKGEFAIKEYLDKKCIRYEREFYFSDLLGRKNKPLRFDFAITDDRYGFMLIEFDGRQHFIFEESSSWGRTFKDVLIRDKMKNEYCKNNKVNLLRIPYNEIKNVEKKLEKNVLEKSSETIQ